MRGSLRTRLTVSMVAGLTVLLVLQAWAVWLGIRHVTENYVASRLQHEAETLLAAVEIDASGEPHLAGAPLAGVYEQPFSGHYYQVAAQAGSLRSRSLWDQELNAGTLEPGRGERMHLAGPQQQPLLVVSRGFRKQGHALSIAVAEDLSALAHDARLFQLGYAGLTALVLAALIAWQWAAVSRALAPLSRAADAVRRLRTGERRELPREVPREIEPLVEEINRLQEITIARLGRSRTAIGNLAHALKTPLTVLGRIAKDPRVRGDSVLAREIDTQVESIRRLVERELSRARLAGGGPTAAAFEPRADLEALADTLRRIHPDVDIALEVDADACPPLDREDIMELAGNVLDNACKWARQRVRVRASAGPGELHLVVEDDGSGAPPGMLESMAQRGTRLDESRPGHGLGLAIAHDIVEQHGGTLAFGASAELGGLRVDVTLPAGADHAGAA